MDRFIECANEGKPLAEPLVFDCHGHFGSEPGFHIPGVAVEEFAAALERVGIDRVAISTFASGIPFGNDAVAGAVSARPDLFIGYARINANYPDVMEDELRRCFDELGFKGIKIHPYGDQVHPDDPRYDPVWEFASERNVPVLSHTWNSLRHSDPLNAYCTPSRFANVVRDRPGVKLILGHSGGEWDGIVEAIQVAKAFPNVFLDTASSRLYPGAIEMMVAEVGADRVLYGSDVPFLSPVPQVGKIVHADIGEAEKRMILGQNAARLFGLDAGR
jgi:predicted TIM-barrel fold metal-dependent hydrolase